MVDPATTDVLTREYHVNLPKNYKAGTQYPIVFWFHGWYGDSDWRPFENVTNNDDVISVYPLGMSDSEASKPDDHSAISWNVGDNGNNASCSPAGNMTNIYKSCRKTGEVSRCNAFTCVDDVYFVKILIKKIKETYCVDESRLYISGASNGGMFTYYLVSHIPELVNGWLLMFGSPMVGYLNTPQAAKDSWLLSLHGRSDTCIPPNGGIDSDESWIFESLDNTFYVWGLIQGCDISSWERVKTPFDEVKGNLNLVCYEYTHGCKSGRALSCLYDG